MAQGLLFLYPFAMETWIYYQPNPCGRSVGDCAVRAIAKALDVNWKRAYALLTEEGYNVCDMPSSDSVWGNVLRKHGFAKRMIQAPMYTARDFCIDHPEEGKVYVLAFGGHVATVVSGFIFDMWNSSNEIVQYFWEMED